MTIFQITQQFFDFDDFHFWSYGELGAVLPPNFGHLGNTLKKSVRDLIFHYDSEKNYFRKDLPTWAQLCHQLSVAELNPLKNCFEKSASKFL